MKIQRIHTANYQLHVDTIKTLVKEACGDFLRAAGRQPLFKTMPSHYDDFRKVKVRFRRMNNEKSELINRSFQDQHNKLYQRSVFAWTDRSCLPATEDAFYIFPINGYEFLYNTEIKNSTLEYQKTLEVLMKEARSAEEANALFSDVLKYTYESNDLDKAFEAKSEVIVHNIPFFYSVRADVIDYDELI